MFIIIDFINTIYALKVITLLLSLLSTSVFSQKNTSFWTPSDTLHKPRRTNLVKITYLVIECFLEL